VTAVGKNGRATGDDRPHPLASFPPCGGALEDLSSATLRSTPFDSISLGHDLSMRAYATRLEYLIMPALMQRARQQQWQVGPFTASASQRARHIEARILSGGAGIMARQSGIPGRDADLPAANCCSEELSVMVGPSPRRLFQRANLSLAGLLDSAHVLVTLSNRSAAMGRSGT